VSGTFLDEIAIGRHVEGHSPLHLAKASWKAMLFALVALTTFFFQSAAAFLGLGTVVAILACCCKLPQQLFWRSLRPINLLALFTMAAGALINHPGASPLHPSFSWEGLHTGGLYAARLVVITLLTTLFFLTTKPKDAIAFGIKALSPLRLLGIEQHELSLLVHLAYRFIPLLRREIEEIRLGRKARNLPPERGALKKLEAALDTLVFLFVGALKRAETTSFALEERGVVDNWKPDEEESESKGVGGWMSLLILSSALLLLWRDPHLL
jgi:energy-coupling factor transport system permease protein